MFSTKYLQAYDRPRNFTICGLNELPSLPSNPISAFDVSHLFEMDAERSAFWASAKTQLDGHENLCGIDALDLPLRMKMVLFSTFLVSQFISETSRGSEVHSLFHPSGELRLLNQVRTIASNLLDEYPSIQTTFADVLAEFATLEDAVTGLMRTSAPLLNFRSERFQANLEKLETNLNALPKMTKKFSYMR